MHTHRRKHAPDPWQSKSESLIKQHRQCKKISYPRDELKFRTVAVCSPTCQQPSAKGTVIAATRERQKVRSRQGAATAYAERLRFANERTFLFGRYRRRLINKEPGI